MMRQRIVSRETMRCSRLAGQNVSRETFFAGRSAFHAESWFETVKNETCFYTQSYGMGPTLHAILRNGTHFTRNLTELGPVSHATS